MDKGKDVGFGEAASSLPFWFYSMASLIILGSTWMIKENTRPFAIGDADQAIFGERMFIVVAAFSSWECGIAATMREKMGPTHVLMVKSGFLVPAFIVMMMPESIPYSYDIMIFMSAWSVGFLPGLC